LPGAAHIPAKMREKERAVSRGKRVPEHGKETTQDGGEEQVRNGGGLDSRKVS